MAGRGLCGAALLVLLVVCLSQRVAAAGSSPAPAAGKAATQQYGGDSYEAKEQQNEPKQEPSKEEAYVEGPQAYELCPDPQPADNFNSVHLAHGTFTWEEVAEDYAESKRGQAAKIQSADAWSSPAVTAAFDRDRKSKRDHKETAAVHDGKTLLPSKLKELDGFWGTTDPVRYPSYEGLGVGPHPHDPDMVFMLHAINGVAEMFLTEKDGTPSDLRKHTKLDLTQLQAVAGYDQEHNKAVSVAAVTAYYDPKARRYAMVWSTTTEVEGLTAPVFVAVSQTRNPLGEWTVWALDLRPSLARGLVFCHDQPAEAYTFDFPQVSFSHDGVFIGGSSSCPCEGEQHRISLAALYVLPKEALYAPPPPPDAPADIYAAVYLTRNSWYRSVTAHELSLTPDAFEPFNSIPAPARPQSPEDMKSPPLFVMKVDNAHLSVATLTDEPINKMVSIDSAPKILAVVVGKGADYAAAEGFSDGNAVMPQPNTTTVLELNYLGMPHTYNGLVFWATQHKGQLYVATGEFWGYDYIRMPSIYWAIIKTTEDLCELTRKDHGLIASKDGLALAYPVIAARTNGGALLAFSYSGKGAIAGGRHPAYPGVATAMVGRNEYDEASDKSVIHVIQPGEGSLDPFHQTGDSSIPWGIGSAAQVCGDQMWFAVPLPQPGAENVYQASPWYGSWITWQQL